MTRILARFFFASGLMWLAAAAVTADPVVVESRAAPVRDAVLFVGSDLFVHHKEDVVPVRRIAGRLVELDTPAHERVSLRQTNGLQLRRATKVSAIDVKIDDWNADRQYSPARNQTLDQMRSQLDLQSYSQDRVEQAEAAVRDYDTPGGSGDAASTASDVPPDPGMLVTQLTEAVRLDNVASQDAGRPPSKGMGGDGADAFDMLVLKFSVSSPQPLQDVNAVVVVRVSVEGEIRDFSFVQGIGRLESKPRAVKITRAGMPEGFEVLETRIHLFVRGEELPTTLSEKRYALTSDEAREYLRLLHLDRHRGATVPAEPAWSMAPPELFALSDVQSVDFPLEVDLDADGRVVSIHESALIVPENVRELVRRLVFVPALQNGLPVASTLRVNPAAFFER